MAKSKIYALAGLGLTLNRLSVMVEESPDQVNEYGLGEDPCLYVLFRA